MNRIGLNSNLTYKTMKNQKITGLWVGETLPLLAQLCIKSFLDHGHEFQLFTYRSYDNIPSGTTVRDAREILPEEAVFYHENGSLAPFADWFRNEFFIREGGYWTDLDVACLSDDFPDADTWFCSQEPGLVAVGVIAFPPHHPLMEALRASAEDPATIMPWDSAEEILAKKNLSTQIPDVISRRRKAPWGHCGPEGFTRALHHFQLMGKSAAPSRLYPLHYSVWRKCYNGDCNLGSPELRNAWAIHLWGEMLRREPDAFENVCRNSIVGQLLDKHLPGHAIIPANQPKKKVNILVGICSCNNAHHRRVACRETWLSHPQPDIEFRFFLGRREPLPNEPDVVNLWVDDGYYHLPAKGLAFYKWALENYDFEWLFKCDDDTYLDLQRLEQVCDDEYDLIGDFSVEKRGTPSGGAGYFLKRSMVEKIVAHYREIPICGAEDVIFGDAVRNLGGKLKADTRLYMGNDVFPSASNARISCHWCSPQRLRDMDMMLYQKPAFTCMGRHSNWQDTVVFYSNGRFMRKNAGCSGSYRIENGRTLVLDWDGWPEERLTLAMNFSNGSGFMLTPDSPIGLDMSLNFTPEE